MHNKYFSRLIFAGILLVGQILSCAAQGIAQSLVASNENRITVAAPSPVAKYSNPRTGMTADQAVAYALEHNGELLAARSEIDAANALVNQAALRANPTLEASGSKTVTGPDNNLMIQGTLPLELGG